MWYIYLGCYFPSSLRSIQSSTLGVAEGLENIRIWWMSSRTRPCNLPFSYTGLSPSRWPQKPQTHLTIQISRSPMFHSLSESWEAARPQSSKADWLEAKPQITLIPSRGSGAEGPFHGTDIVQHLRLRPEDLQEDDAHSKCGGNPKIGGQTGTKTSQVVAGVQRGW